VIPDSFAKILDDEEIKYVIMQPRDIPRRNREDMAEILYREIMLGEDYEIKDAPKFIEKFGVFYLLLTALKGSEEWERLKSLARSSHISSLLILRIVLSNVFDMLDGLTSLEDIVDTGRSGQMALMVKQFKVMLESTLELWNRRIADNKQPAIEMMEQEEPGDVRFFGEVGRFAEDKDAREFLGILSSKALMAGILSEVSEIEDHLSSLEMLTLLFPGRNWDRSMLELHTAHFLNLNKYAKIVERNEDIRKVLDAIGRIGAEPGDKSQSLSSFSRSELYSVSLSSDMEHMLPVESVKLMDETMKYLFFSKWIEGKLLTYQLKGNNWAGGAKKIRGPMVAMVDTSGSMHGDPELLAKSIVLAMVRRMLKESRDVKVFLFSSVGQTHDIEMTDMNKMAPEFLDFLNYTFEGGTDFNTALQEGLETLKENRYVNADILFITDGLSVVNDERVVSGLEDIKKSQCTRIFTIIVGNDDAGGIDHLSDHVFIIEKTDRHDTDNDLANTFRLVSSR
jgi:uncharacterized protein with von Willebrand factor type A (vWA) domain